MGWRHGIGAALTALLLGTGCAQVEAPSGGPVDSEKPRVVGMFPDSGSTGELPDTLSILFSKKMDRKSVRDWLFVSPPVAIRERLWKDNRLDLPLLSPPDSGQTYSVLLGAEVKDLRGNALGPWAAPFATADHLDDGLIEGAVRGGRLKTADVYLYVWPWDVADSLEGLDTSPPLRMGQVARNGQFRIAALPRGLPLRICALYDARRNRSYDADEDVWGCLDGPLVLDDTTQVVSELTVYLVLPDEPGLLKGTAADSSCIGRGAVVLERLKYEADSLFALIVPPAQERADTLLGFAVARPDTVDSAAVAAQLARIDTLRIPARVDSIRCAQPVIVRLFENDTSLVAETRTAGEFSFSDIAPGIYSLHAFLDSNGNGMRDPDEIAGTYRFPIEARPGREIADLEIVLRPGP